MSRWLCPQVEIFKWEAWKPGKRRVLQKFRVLSQVMFMYGYVGCHLESVVFGSQILLTSQFDAYMMILITYVELSITCCWDVLGNGCWSCLHINFKGLSVFWQFQLSWVAKKEWCFCQGDLHLLCQGIVWPILANAKWITVINVKESITNNFTFLIYKQ